MKISGRRNPSAAKTTSCWHYFEGISTSLSGFSLTGCDKNETFLSRCCLGCCVFEGVRSHRNISVWQVSESCIFGLGPLIYIRTEPPLPRTHFPTAQLAGGKVTRRINLWLCWQAAAVAANNFPLPVGNFSLAQAKLENLTRGLKSRPRRNYLEYVCVALAWPPVGKSSTGCWMLLPLSCPFP